MNIFLLPIYSGVKGDTPLDYNLKIINVVCMVATVITVSYLFIYGALAYFLGGTYHYAFFALLCLTPFFIFVFILTGKRKRDAAAAMLLLNGVAATVGMTLFTLGPSLGIHFYAMAIPGLALLMLNQKGDIKYFSIYSAISIAGFVSAEYFFTTPLFPSFPPDFPYTYVHMMNSICTILLTMISVFVFATDLNAAREKITIEHDRANALLLNILPEPIAKRLKTESQTIADGFPETSIMFADIVGFTELASAYNPTELVSLLNDYFSAFDKLTDKYKLEKIKTIGDAYMVASGIPTPCSDHAQKIANFSIEMMEETAKISQSKGIDISLRIGINSGPVTAGVIGQKKFIYDLWGDAVNVASRMESHGLPNHIQVTESTYRLLNNTFQFQNRGEIEVKGKGKVNAYILTSRIGKSNTTVTA